MLEPRFSYSHLKDVYVEPNPELRLTTCEHQEVFKSDRLKLHFNLPSHISGVWYMLASTDTDKLEYMERLHHPSAQRC